MSEVAKPMLEVKGLSSGYGDVSALNDVDIHVAAGAITALIGANGAGKTTLMRTLAGLMPATNGRVTLNGRDISSHASHRRVNDGMVLVPEGRLIFGLLSVEQNLRLGAIVPRAREDNERRLQEIFRMFPRLSERKRQLAGSMSGGEQQMLAIGRGLMAKPDLILFDEPAFGLAPVMVKQVFGTITELRRRGHTILLAEQNSRLALEVCDFAYVLQNGRVVMSETREQLSESEAVRKAFLGF